MDLKKYKFALVPGGIILGTVLFLILFLPGQIRSISKEIKTNEREKKEISELKQKYLLVSSLDKEVLTNQVLSTLSALPEDKNVPYVLQGLRQAVSGAGFLIQELKFSPGEIKKEEVEAEETKGVERKLVEQLPLTVNLVGPFDDLLLFFEKLEKTLPLFQILSVEAMNPEKAEFSGRAEMRLITFYSPPKRSEGKKIGLDDLILTEKESALLEELPQYQAVNIEKRPGGPRRGLGEDPFKL